MLGFMLSAMAFGFANAPVDPAEVAAQIVAYQQQAVATQASATTDDFRVCDDGRVLIFPSGHPLSCSQ